MIVDRVIERVRRRAQRKPRRIGPMERLRNLVATPHTSRENGGIRRDIPKNNPHIRHRIRAAANRAKRRNNGRN